MLERVSRPLVTHRFVSWLPFVVNSFSFLFVSTHTIMARDWNSPEELQREQGKSLSSLSCCLTRHGDTVTGRCLLEARPCAGGTLLVSYNSIRSYLITKLSMLAGKWPFHGTSSGPFLPAKRLFVGLW